MAMPTPAPILAQHVKGRLLFFDVEERTAADLVFQQLGGHITDKFRCYREGQGSGSLVQLKTQHLKAVYRENIPLAQSVGGF